MMELIDINILKSHAKDVTLQNGAKHRCIDSTIICELPKIEIIRCKDCKSFGIKEHWINAPLPVLVATVPTCTKLEIKTHPEGYCFLAKRK